MLGNSRGGLRSPCARSGVQAGDRRRVHRRERLAGGRTVRDENVERKWAGAVQMRSWARAGGDPLGWSISVGTSGKAAESAWGLGDDCGQMGEEKEGARFASAHAMRLWTCQRGPAGVRGGWLSISAGKRTSAHCSCWDHDGRRRSVRPRSVRPGRLVRVRSCEWACQLLPLPRC